MRLSELSAAAGLPVATVKYYLRERLLSPGETINRTQAGYGQSHVERLRLVRALTEVGGLSVSAARGVTQALDHPPPARHDLLGAVQSALTAADGEATCEEPVLAEMWEALTRAGWRLQAEEPLVMRLAMQVAAARAAGLTVDGPMLAAYAAAATQIAAVDVASVPSEPQDALRYVVVGTVLLEPVLATLRRLAHQDQSARVLDPG